jgi:hypothetical protein
LIRSGECSDCSSADIRHQVLLLLPRSSNACDIHYEISSPRIFPGHLETPTDS